MAVLNLAQFNGAVEAFEKKLMPEDVLLFTRRLALEVLQRVVQKTPVDTGRARGNWQINLGGPTVGESGSTDRGGGSTVTNGAAALDRAEPFQAIYVGNNVPYIEALEGGHSDQAPNGMAALTIAEIEAVFG